MINYFKKGGTFTNIDITKLDGYDRDNLEHEDIAWSTEKVEKVIKDYQDGFIELTRIKNSPFVSNDITYRKPRLTFEYTKEEIEELRKCAKDPIYFADKYCKLKTGVGYENIKLRDYQQGLLEGFVSHSQCIVLASRQIGKCLIFNELVEINGKKIKLGDISKESSKEILAKVRSVLYKLYSKKILKRIVGYAIQFTEWLLFNDKELINDKFIYHESLSNVEVLSHDGYKKATDLYITKPYQVYEVKFIDGSSIECADNHLFFDANMNTVYAKDLSFGSCLCGKNGTKIVEKVIKHHYKFCMYDISVDSDEHSYYTSDVLSHNTTTSAIFILWFVLFHKEKNVLMLGDILDTTKEIIDKVKQILNNLPFFMKPGIIINNVQSMRFDNGCRIIGRSTTKKSAIGLSIDLLYMDEFAHISASFIDDFWRSTYPTISGTPGSRVIVTSTPNGRNKFNVLWEGAIDAIEREGDSGFFPMRVDWWQVDGRDEEWKQKTIADLGSIEDFNQEYGLQFFKGDNLLLNSSDIKKLYNVKSKFISREVECMTMNKMYFKEGAMHYTMTDFSDSLTWNQMFLKNTFTKDRVNLKSDDNYYVIGIDTAKGVGRDFHVANIFKVAPMPISRVLQNRTNIEEEINVFSLVQIGKFRSNNINIETFADVVNSIVFDLFDYEHVRIGIELNNQGIIVRDRLMRNGNYWNGMIIYNRKSETDLYYEPGTNLSSNKMKVNFCESYQHNVSIDRIITTDDTTFNEISNFGSNDNRSIYRCQAGHDDLVMSCVHANAFIGSPQYKEIGWDIWEKMELNQKWKDYIHCVQYDVIEENNKKYEAEHATFNPDDVADYNS